MGMFGDLLNALVRLGENGRGIGEARRDLEQIADANVQASLQIVATGRPREPDPAGTVAFSAGASTSGGRRFRILSTVTRWPRPPMRSTSSAE